MAGSPGTKIEANMLPEDLSVVALAFDPLPPAALYAGTSTGKRIQESDRGQPMDAVRHSSRANPSPGWPSSSGSRARSTQGSTTAVGSRSRARTPRLDRDQRPLVARHVGGFGFDPEGTDGLNAGTLYAATLGGGIFGYDFDSGPNPPLVSITAPVPPTFTIGTSPVQTQRDHFRVKCLLVHQSRSGGVSRSTNRDRQLERLRDPRGRIERHHGHRGRQRPQPGEPGDHGDPQTETGPVIFVNPLSVPFGTVAVGSTSALQM